MKVLSTEGALVAIQLQQILMEFAHELDRNEGRGIADFYADDGVFTPGDFAFRGRAAIAEFYAKREERVAAEQAGGQRTGRHTYVNPRVEIHDADNASLHFICVHYSAAGAPPIPDASTPSVVADARMDFRREADGDWRITVFDSYPMFLGQDPFVKKMLVKS